jgi:hypothetical protein
VPAVVAPGVAALVLKGFNVLTVGALLFCVLLAADLLIEAAR